MSELSPKLENFERAFNSGCGGCVRTCECGRVFFDAHNSYDWEDGELERLTANPKATSLDYCVSTISCEGREYVADCDCWHSRAYAIMGFIDAHAHKIALYLRLEKKRKQDIADAAPIVDEEGPNLARGASPASEPLGSSIDHPQPGTAARPSNPQPPPQ